MLKQIETRRSIRKYTAQPVEEVKLASILESGRLAPSGSNTQPWRFIVVKSEANREKLATAAHNQQWMVSAPVFIVGIADIACRIEDTAGLALHENSPQLELKQIIRDTSIAIEHMAIEAANQGLGTCWVAWFTQEEIRPILNIPADKYVVGILTLGYPAESPEARPRKHLEDLVRYENW